MIAAYRVFSSFLYILALPFLRAKAVKGDPVWRGRLLLDVPTSRADIWIHAASAGEARMAAILISHLRRATPQTTIHVTVMTRAGYEAALDAVSPDVTVSYFPIDLSRHITKLFETLQPRVLVVAETEIWPNLVTGASRRNIPIVLVNGRMSSKAFGRYKIIRRMFAGLLSRYNRFFLKSEEDLKRYAFFGVEPHKAVVTGDMKFDAPMALRSEGRIRELRFRAGVTDSQALLVAGSTRPGEESLLLAVYTMVRKAHPGFRLLLAPRHLERLDEVARIITDSGYSVRRFGDDSAGMGDEIILLDRMGILAELYTAADIAFVGGTLVNLGGHNLLEPVWAGTPVLYGPSTENVVEAAAYIEEHGFGRRVGSAEELARVVIEVLDGKTAFVQKTEDDVERSATADAVRYITELVKESIVHA